MFLDHFKFFLTPAIIKVLKLLAALKRKLNRVFIMVIYQWTFLIAHLI